MRLCSKSSIFRALGNITFILVKRLDELVIKPLEGSMTLYYLTNNVIGIKLIF
jgi:hypothetical protein